ncbi:MAG: hypothetical protein O7D91_16920 [Planctomycetota bacterium]|nr:hypothetical protein [Planctomycetota bacterium]
MVKLGPGLTRSGFTSPAQERVELMSETNRCLPANRPKHGKSLSDDAQSVFQQMERVLRDIVFVHSMDPKALVFNVHVRVKNELHQAVQQGASLVPQFERCLREIGVDNGLLQGVLEDLNDCLTYAKQLWTAFSQRDDHPKRLERRSFVQTMMNRMNMWHGRWLARVRDDITPKQASGATDADAPSTSANADGPDEHGFVAQPADATGYVRASDVLNHHTPLKTCTTHRQLVAILKKHPEIKRWKPRSNRLSVHVADWRKFVKKREANSGGADPDESKIEERKAAIRKSTYGK